MLQLLWFYDFNLLLLFAELYMGNDWLNATRVPPWCL